MNTDYDLQHAHKKRIGFYSYNWNYMVSQGLFVYGQGKHRDLKAFEVRRLLNSAVRHNRMEDHRLWVLRAWTAEGEKKKYKYSLNLFQGPVLKIWLKHTSLDTNVPAGQNSQVTRQWRCPIWVWPSCRPPASPSSSPPAAIPQGLENLSVPPQSTAGHFGPFAWDTLQVGETCCKRRLSGTRQNMMTWIIESNNGLYTEPEWI